MQPIHIRARPGDYAEVCLLPGDPSRATHIAEHFLEDATQRNHERGLLGYTGVFNGRPVSVQTTGMGCPSAAIVVEELLQLGVKRFLRVGQCGGLQPEMELGEIVLALSAAPGDGLARHYVGHEPYAPTASWELVRAVIGAAERLGLPVRVGPIASTDTFTTHDPDRERECRWAKRGILAVEMEAAVIFTIAALRGAQAGCLVSVADVASDDGFVRISEEQSAVAVDRMIGLALESVTCQ